MNELIGVIMYFIICWILLIPAYFITKAINFNRTKKRIKSAIICVPVIILILILFTIWIGIKENQINNKTGKNDDYGQNLTGFIVDEVVPAESLEETLEIYTEDDLEAEGDPDPQIFYRVDYGEYGPGTWFDMCYDAHFERGVHIDPDTGEEYPMDGAYCPICNGVFIE